MRGRKRCVPLEEASEPSAASLGVKPAVTSEAGKVISSSNGSCASNSPGDPASVGYLDNDFQMRLFPPLSLYPMSSDGTNCPLPAGHFVSFNGAGITVDPGSGAIWFADYCRRRLGRLSKR